MFSSSSSSAVFAFLTLAFFSFFPFILAILFIFTLLSFFTLLVEIILFFLNVLLLVFFSSLCLLDGLRYFFSGSLFCSAHLACQVLLCALLRSVIKLCKLGRSAVF